jgi:hypothetical protein
VGTGGLLRGPRSTLAAIAKCRCENGLLSAEFRRRLWASLVRLAQSGPPSTPRLGGSRGGE